MKGFLAVLAMALLALGGCAVSSVDLQRDGVLGSVLLEKDGTRWNSRTGSSELWTVAIGDTSVAEKRAAPLAKSLGPYALNATLWVRVPAKVSGWKKATFRRPVNIDELAKFIGSKKNFYSESYEPALPPPLDRLTDEEIAQIDFVISYADGGMKVYLFGVAPEETRAMFLKIQTLSR